MLGTMMLSGWKEIAQYLRCSLRSAQRYQSIGLPIKRLHPGRGPVVAYSEDIDAWVRGLLSRSKGARTTPTNVMRSRELRAQVERSTEKLRKMVEELMKTVESIQAKKN